MDDSEADLGILNFRWGGEGGELKESKYIFQIAQAAILPFLNNLIHLSNKKIHLTSKKKKEPK